MATFLDKDYNEVEAFTQAELDAKIAESKKEWDTEAKKSGSNASEELKKAQNALKEKTDEYDELSSKYDKRKDEYDNAKKALKDKETEIDTVRADKTKTFEKLRDDSIIRAAGEDKEYAENLRKQFDRLNGTNETLDPTVIESTLKESHALALNSMNREFAPFTLNTTVGKAPDAGGEKKGSTENVDKAVDYASHLLGLPTEDKK